jgi:hypothetical protein
LKTFSFLFFMRFLALLLCFALPLSAEKMPVDISREAITPLIVTKAQKTRQGINQPWRGASTERAKLMRDLKTRVRVDAVKFTVPKL